MKKKVLSLFLIMSVTFALLAGCSTSLTINIYPAGSGTVNSSGNPQNRGAAVGVTAAPAPGYRFDHWSGDTSGSSPNAQLVMNSSKNVDAYFTRVYTLSASCSPASGGSVSPTGGTFDEGSNISLIANPAQDYKFNGWAGDASGNIDHTSITMNSNKQVVASFIKLQYSLQTQSVPADGGTINPNSGTFEAGIQLNFTVSPNNGYRFDRWSGDITGNSDKTNLLMSSNHSVTANFIKVYKLNVNAPPDVGATVSPNSGVYDSGTKVTLTAKATICPYAFDHWSSTDNDNVNPTIVTMNSDKSITEFMKKLVGGQPTTKSENIWGGGTISIPFDLNQFEWVQGEIWGPSIAASIRDTNGTIVKDLGIVTDANFTLNAATAGHYSFVLYNTNVLSAAAYRLTYTIYH